MTNLDGLWRPLFSFGLSYLFSATYAITVTKDHPVIRFFFKYKLPGSLFVISSFTETFVRRIRYIICIQMHTSVEFYLHILKHFSFLRIIHVKRRRPKKKRPSQTLTENFHSAYANQTSILTLSSVGTKTFYVHFHKNAQRYFYFCLFICTFYPLDYFRFDSVLYGMYYMYAV